MGEPTREQSREAEAEAATSILRGGRTGGDIPVKRWRLGRALWDEIVVPATGNTNGIISYQGIPCLLDETLKPGEIRAEVNP